MDLLDYSVQQLVEKLNESNSLLAELHDYLDHRYRIVQEKFNIFISFNPDILSTDIKNIGENTPAFKKQSLRGVPFALADNIATSTLRTTCASKLLSSYQPPFDAQVTSRLKESGAILAGKTNMEEFGVGSSGESSFFQAVKNPLDMQCTAGNGAAAAVLTGCVTFSLASDACGELRQAASYCGVTGMKPTYGRIPRKGLLDYASSLEQIGIIARSAADLAATLEIASGDDARDHTTLQAEVPPFLSLIEQKGKNIKVAVLENWSEAPYLEDELRKAFQDCLKELQGLGITVNSVTLPHFKYAFTAAAIISAVEAFSNLANYDGIRFGYRKEAEHLQKMYLKTRSEGFSSKLKKLLAFGALISTAKYYHDYFLQAQKMRTVITQELEECLREYDLLLTPTTPFRATPLGSPLSKTELPDPASYFTAAANLAGLPALTFPLNTSGLPYGLQFTGKRGDELILLQAASLLEKENLIKTPKFVL